MKVLTEGLSLRAIGKTIEQYDAESIGFLRFDPEGAALFTRIVEQALRTPEGLKRWYLSVINQIAQEHDVVRVQSIQGLQWAEMDLSPPRRPRSPSPSTARAATTPTT